MFMARIHPLVTIGVLLGVTASVAPVHSQEPFYKGKTIRMIVGLAPGGGYDTYSRLIARHMSRYIPGNPAIVVENMDGAGSVIAANHIYKVAKPDGLTIGDILGGQRRDLFRFQAQRRLQAGEREIRLLAPVHRARQREAGGIAARGFILHLRAAGIA